MKKIGINIWDDYIEDELSIGNDQHTYMYVEKSESEFSFKEQEYLLGSIYCMITKVLYVYLNLNTKFDFIPTESECRPEIIIENLSHKDKETLIKELQSTLFNSICDFYSES